MIKILERAHKLNRKTFTNPASFEGNMSHVESPSESEDSEWIEESESESGSDSETEIESDPEPLDFDSIYHSFAVQ